MKMWVDADACPKPIKEILFRAAERVHLPLTLVANHFLKTPPSKYIRAIQVANGFDVADNKIVQLVEAGDLVVTQDIPLAAEVLKKGAIALNPRGQRYTESNIGERLAMRDIMDELRGTSMQLGGGPAAFSQRECNAFASQLDQILTRYAQA